jgi:hypothetical protein
MTGRVWLDRARTYIGLKEIPGPKSSPVSYAGGRLSRRLSGDDLTPWCGAFVGGVLAECGLLPTRQSEISKMRMKTYAPILVLLSLLISGCSWTAKPVVVSVPVVVRETVPAALLLPYPPKSRKPLATTGDVVNRLTYTEGALATCSAQVDGIRK